MTIKEQLKEQKTLFSFEFFPPKDEAGEAQLYQTIEDLRALKPSYVSVTYGAMGTSQDRTLFFVKKIHRELGVDVMAHFTCICADKERVRSFVQELNDEGISNILALRGDFPPDMPKDQALGGPFKYANELVSEIRTYASDFTVCVAGYPEKHPEASGMNKDIENLARKVKAGADAIITQLFFDNRDFYRYCDAVRDRGITVPIIAGIMPILNMKQIQGVSEKCKVSIPRSIRDFFSKNRTPEDMQKFGIDYAHKQCADLVRNGVAGIHFYTFNRSKATMMICKELMKK